MKMSKPTWTRDAETMKRDIEEHGYCLFKDALTPEQLAEARERLSEQAEAERKAGFGYFHNGKIRVLPEDKQGINQNVSFLANKGRIFREIASRTDVLDIVCHVLGEEIRIQNLLANIIRMGGQPQTLHQDQWFLPSASRYEDPPIKAGSITRGNPGQPETPGATLMPCVLVNAFWMLDDFTIENGATCLVPGSHKLGRRPNEDDRKNQIQVTGPAGSLFIFDGRVFHGAGAHLSDDPAVERKGLTFAYIPPMIKPHENYTLALLPEVYEEAPQELLDLMGFKIWFNNGHLGDHTAKRISRETPIIGELKLSAGQGAAETAFPVQAGRGQNTMVVD
jgi:ectoine hydroxylase-related dioxygenase (phytanoyl-CoA dioxygenase family)